MTLYNKIKRSLAYRLSHLRRPVDQDAEELYRELRIIERKINSGHQRKDILIAIVKIAVKKTEKNIIIDPFHIKKVISTIEPNLRELKVIYRYIFKHNKPLLKNPYFFYLLNDHDRAIITALKHIRKNGLNPNNLFIFVDSALDGKKTNPVESFFTDNEELIKKTFGKAFFSNAIAALHSQHGKHPNRLFTLYADHKPGLHWTLNILEELLEEGFYEETITYIAALTDYYPENDWLAARLAEAHLCLGQIELAHSNYQRSYELYDKNDHAINGLLASSIYLDDKKTIENLAPIFISRDQRLKTLASKLPKTCWPNQPSLRLSIISNILRADHFSQYRSSHFDSMYSKVIENTAPLEAYKIQAALYYGDNEEFHQSPQLVEQLLSRYATLSDFIKSSEFTKLNDGGLQLSPSFYASSANSSQAFFDQQATPSLLIALASLQLDGDTIKNFCPAPKSSSTAVEFLAVDDFFHCYQQTANYETIPTNHKFTHSSSHEQEFKTALDSTINSAKNSGASCIALINPSVDAKSLGFIEESAYNLNQLGTTNSIAYLGNRNRNFRWNENLNSRLPSEASSYSSLMKSPCVIVKLENAEEFIRLSDTHSIFDFFAYLILQHCLVLDSFGSIIWDNHFSDGQHPIAGSTKLVKWSEETKSLVSFPDDPSSELYEFSIEDFQELLDKGKALDTKSGIFNPSLAYDLDGKLYCTLRVEPNFNAWTGITSSLWKTPSHSILVTLGEGEPLHNHNETLPWSLLSPLNFPDKCRIEDMRLLGQPDGLNATVAVFIENPFFVEAQDLESLGFTITNHDLYELMSAPRLVFQAFTSVSPEQKTFYSERRFNLWRDWGNIPMPIEKNWCFHNNEAGNKFIYSMIPLSTYDISDHFTVTERWLSYNWSIKGDNPLYPISIGTHASTNAPETFYFGFHTRGEGYSYNNGICRVTYKDNNTELAITPDPVLCTSSDVDVSNKHSKVLYLSSLLALENMTVLGFGLYDSKAVLMTTKQLADYTFIPATESFNKSTNHYA